jgi:hypothetical protein
MNDHNQIAGFIAFKDDADLSFSHIIILANPKKGPHCSCWVFVVMDLALSFDQSHKFQGRKFSLRVISPSMRLNAYPSVLFANFVEETSSSLSFMLDLPPLRKVVQYNFS